MSALGDAALLAAERGEVDDPAAAVGAHALAGGAAAGEGAAEVDRQHLVPLARLEVPEVAGDGQGGVVDEDVEAALALAGLGDQGVDGVPVGDVDLVGGEEVVSGG